MSDLRSHLQAGDPLRHAPALTRDDVDRMRRFVVAAARKPRARLSATAFTLLAGLTTAASAAVWVIDKTLPTVRTSEPTALVANGAAPSDRPRRQVHFSTPGGTRLIWVFNPEFENR